MDHTHPLFEIYCNLTTEEKLQLLDTLMETDLTEVNIQALAPSLPQYRELCKLRRQYAYQRKMTERELLSCDKDKVDDLLVSCGRAQGAVEVLDYILSTTSEVTSNELN